MADATIDYENETLPGVIYAKLTVSDGETLKPRLGKIKGVVPGDNRTSGYPQGTTGTAVTASFSSTTITFNCPGITDADVSIIAYGLK